MATRDSAGSVVPEEQAVTPRRPATINAVAVSAVDFIVILILG
jgi:hypothetical protein